MIKPLHNITSEIPPKPGDRCPQCGHYLTIIESRVISHRSRKQRIGCDNRKGKRGCGYKPADNVRYKSVDEVPGRVRFAGG